MLSDELERLQQLRNSGALTEQEFQQAKQQVLTGGTSAADPFAGTAAVSAPASDKVCGMDAKVWITLMHLSQLLTWTVLGIAVPIVMWLLSKDESRDANRHGLVILNWLLSSLIYAVISGILIFVFIGFPMLAVLFALNIIFPIYGAIQANSGRLWKYPLTIHFFNPDAV
jgi:uncharacterized Tic20 family protein